MPSSVEKPIESAIVKKITEVLAPFHLEVFNESHMHSVPANSETHFKVLVVSNAFEGLGRVQRQQKVYETLKEELQSGVHALSQQTFTEQEWQQSPHRISSPECASRTPKKN